MYGVIKFLQQEDNMIINKILIKHDNIEHEVNSEEEKNQYLLENNIAEFTLENISEEIITPSKFIMGNTFNVDEMKDLNYDILYHKKPPTINEDGYRTIQEYYEILWTDENKNSHYETQTITEEFEYTLDNSGENLLAFLKMKVYAYKFDGTRELIKEKIKAFDSDDKKFNEARVRRTNLINKAKKYCTDNLSNNSSTTLINSLGGYIAKYVEGGKSDLLNVIENSTLPSQMKSDLNAILDR